MDNQQYQIFEKSLQKKGSYKKGIRMNREMMGVGWVEGINRKIMRIVEGHSRKPNFYHIFQKERIEKLLKGNYIEYNLHLHFKVHQNFFIV